MKYITGHPTSNFPTTSNNLVLRSVHVRTAETTYVHHTTYQILLGGLVVPLAARNLAVAVQDAIRVYLGVCTPVTTLIRVNTPGQMYTKIRTGLLADNQPMVVLAYFGTLTSSPGNWTFYHQYWANTDPTPPPFDYTAPCMIGPAPLPLPPKIIR